MSSLLPSSSIVVAAKRTSQYPMNFLEVIRFSFPVPEVGPSDPTLSPHITRFCRCRKHKKSPTRASLSRKIVGKSRLL